MDRTINAELAFVFSQLRDEQLILVPNEIKGIVGSDFDKDVFESFDAEKPFVEQELSEETLQFLSEIFKNTDKII